MEAPTFAECGRCNHNDVRGCVLFRDEMTATFERIERLAVIAKIALPPVEVSVAYPCLNALNWSLHVAGLE
jgi:hypothetical protein